MMQAAISLSTAEAVGFFIIAALMIVAAAYGLLIARKAVYTTISVIFVMVCLAVLYTMLEAPFMGVAQVVVYTGAILMMFLFVLMLVGVDSADSGHETLKAQKPVALLGGLGIAAILIAVVFGFIGAGFDKAPAGVKQDIFPIGLEAANANGNPVGVSHVIFNNFVLTLEITGCLLIVAALGAMTLTHRDKVHSRLTQSELATQKMLDFTEKGVHPGHLPNAGVFAESNSSTNPSLTYGGKPAEGSINRVLAIRGQGRSLPEVSPGAVDIISHGPGLHGPSTYGAITRASVPGMPGIAAPDYETAAKRHELTPGKTQEAQAPEASDVVEEHQVTETHTDKGEVK
ncbi:NADH-quinone oxidoreductase subunit J [Arcanobacterium canis]